MIGPSAAEVALPEAAFEGQARRPAQSYWSESWERIRGNRVGIAAGTMLILLLLVAVGAPLIAQHVTHWPDPNRQFLKEQFAPPNPRHWLGADEFGRDLLTRLVYGARVSFTIVFLAPLISYTLGATVGVAAGFYGRWVDRILMRAVDLLPAEGALTVALGEEYFGWPSD